MSTPTIPYYPITHDDGLDIIDALGDIKNAISANPVWGDITGAISDQTDLQTALNAKQATYSADATQWDTTPTASSTNPVTSGGIKTYTDNKILYFYQQSTSVTSSSTAEFCRITDSRINTDTVVLNMSFSDSSYITTGISWSSASGYISLKGICTNSNCKVNIVLGQKGN